MRVAASYEGQQLDHYCRGRCKAAASLIFPSLSTSAQLCTPAVCLPACPLELQSAVCSLHRILRLKTGHCVLSTKW